MFRFPTRSKGASHIRSRFSADGNQARDRQAWAEAAGYYRSHLLLAPHDAAIWVQLGHMLKEAGDRNESIAAYRKAWHLMPGDGDILLHFGHALIASGDMQNGLERLRESAAAGNSHAGRDLALLGEPFINGRPSQHIAASKTLLDQLSAHAKRLRAVEYADIGFVKNGLKSSSNDPWIVFEWEKMACPPTKLALLTIDIMAPLDGDIEPTGQLYADLGEGFSERNSSRFTYGKGRTRILLIKPQKMTRLRLDPAQSDGVFPQFEISIDPLESMEAVEELVRSHCPTDADLDLIISLLTDIHESKDVSCPLPPVIAFDFEISRSTDFSHDYDYWLFKNANPNAADYQRMREMDAALAIRPLFSFVMPTYNTPDNLLRECLDGLLAQTYEDFEICIADDNSPNASVAETLIEYAERDSRVKFVKRKVNGHISAASNSALALASGDFIVLVDHDDIIPDYTLSVLAQYISRYPDADILFSDEDKITTSGHRLHPYFKCNFNKYLMYGHNMVSHLGVYRRSLVERVGGFRLGLEGSQDYDLLLRCFEQSDENRVVHIPHVLYNWRIIPGSTAMSADQKSYAVIAAQNAINGHFERQGMPLRSIDGFAPGCTAVRPSHTFDTPVTVIIPTRNGLDLLRPCIESILARDCENVEIIVVDNGSDDPETLAYLKELGGRDDIRILTDSGDFNFSRINNAAAETARGEILCFLNNDTEVISADWLNRARTFLSMDEVGIVGARLLFPDGALQHFGIALGMGDHRIAGVPHLGFEGGSPGYFGKARLLQEVSAVTAACMFIRKADFMEVGGFDEELRVAYNDIDLCLKIREKDLKILVDPDITLTHKESRTRGSDKHGARAQRLAQEAEWMRARWSQVLDNDPYYSPNLDLNRVDFAYAAKPRSAWPWQDGWQKDHPTRE